ncbi:hypothetical protein FRC07_010153 [Ceratobasidium sp. 392]|nr:hypothetical protein FRC07_010153 [Ceratobasidium sp. 392]
MDYYSFPPRPASKHLELQTSKKEGQTPEPAPPIPHAGTYMDIAGIRRAQASRPQDALQSPERQDARESPSTERKDVPELLVSPGKKRIQLPWDRKHGRSQSDIASGLATTLQFGAAAVPAEAAAHFEPSDEYSPRRSSEK